MESLKFKVEIDSSASTKSIKEIGPAAKKAEKEVSKAMNKAEDSIQDVGEEAKTASKKTKELGDAAGDTATSAGQLSGALDLVSPAAGDVARVVADAADALEVFTKALNVSKAGAGLVGATIAALGAIYLYLKDQLDDAEEAQEAMSEAATAAESKFSSLKSIVSGLADEMRILNGVSQAEIDLERQQEQINAQYRVAVKNIDDQIASRRRLQDEIDLQTEADRQAWRAQSAIIANLNVLREKTIERRDAALETSQVLHDARQQEIEDAEALREAERLRREQEAAAREAAAEKAAAEEAASKLEQERFANKAAETAAEMARLEELAELEKQIAAEREARDKAAHEANLQRIEQQKSNMKAIASASNELVTTMSDGFMELAEAQAAAGNDAALANFERAQKLAIAEVMFSLASGMMEAAKMGPIAGAIYGLALGAASTVQIARINAQEPPTIAHMGDTGLTQRMHMGGTVDSAGQQTVILRNEAVLDSATTRRLGPEGVQSLLNGAYPGPIGQWHRTVVTYRHLDQAVGDLLKNNGSRSARNARSAARQPSTMGTTRAYQ